MDKTRRPKLGVSVSMQSVTQNARRIVDSRARKDREANPEWKQFLRLMATPMKIPRELEGSQKKLNKFDKKRNEADVDVFAAGFTGYGDEDAFNYSKRVVRIESTFPAKRTLKLACGEMHFLALTTSGWVFSWGSGDEGKLGHGTVKNELQPRVIDSLIGHKIVDIACGSRHSCVVDESGTVYCFGRNNEGQCGSRTATFFADPHIVDGLRGKNVTNVSCGSETTYALAGCTLFSFGHNGDGQLGHLNTVSLTCAVPKAVAFLNPLTPWDSQRVLRIQEQDTVHAFIQGNTAANTGLYGLYTYPFTHGSGASTHLQYTSPYAATANPNPTANPNANSMGIGSGFAAAVAAATSQQVGDRGKSFRPLVFSAGDGHAAAVDEEGSLWTWGRGTSGQLGHGDWQSYPHPKKVVLPHGISGGNHRGVVWRFVTCGYDYTLGITAQNQLYAWGAGKRGCLGHGNEEDIGVPTAVSALSGIPVVAAFAGISHSVVVTSFRQIYVFGDNTMGQLGGDTWIPKSPSSYFDPSSTPCTPPLGSRSRATSAGPGSVVNPNPYPTPNPNPAGGVGSPSPGKPLPAAATSSNPAASRNRGATMPAGVTQGKLNEARTSFDGFSTTGEGSVISEQTEQSDAFSKDFAPSSSGFTTVGGRLSPPTTPTRSRKPSHAGGKGPVTRSSSRRSAGDRSSNHGSRNRLGTPGDFDSGQNSARSVLSTQSSTKLPRMYATPVIPPFFKDYMVRTAGAGAYSMVVICETPAEEDIRELEELFHKYDADHNGALSEKEFWNLLAEMRCVLPPKEFQILLRQMDSDGNGEVTWDEVLANRVHILALQERFHDQKSRKRMEKEWAQSPHKDGGMAALSATFSSHMST